MGNILVQALQGRRGGVDGTEERLNEEMEKKLNKLPEKEQLNQLYSAVIDGDKKLIARIVDVGDPDIFTKVNMEKIAEASKKVAQTQEISKKTIIKQGIKTLAKEAVINIGIGGGGRQ